MRDWHGARLAAIENRLTALDGGDDAEAAMRSALGTADGHRCDEGESPLGFRLAGSGDTARVEWIGSNTTDDGAHG
jgi:hypothetical protein